MALTDKLTVIADAIRAKTGKTDALTLDQMATEIEGITTGGTEDLDAVLTEQEALIATLQDTLRGKSSGDSTLEDGLVTRTLNEYRNDRVTTVGSYAFANFPSLERVILPMAKTLSSYAFANDTALKHIDILGGGTLSGSTSSSCLLQCNNLETVIVRNENEITKLQTLLFPVYAGEANITRNFKRSQWKTYGSIGHTENWSGLDARVKGSITYFKGTVTDEASKPVWLFGEYNNNSTQLKTLAFAETEEEANALMLQYTEYFRDKGCKFYFSSPLVDAHKTATNWVTYADRIHAIEDHPEITGE